MAGKRSNGEGYVSQQKNGKWRGQLMDGFTDEGKKKVVSFSGVTKAEVVRKIRDYQSNKDAGFNLDKKMTFTSWADLWYKDYKTQVSPSTYCNYKYTLKLLKEEFGNIPIADILPMHINKYFAKLLNSRCSSSKINKCRTMLIQIFDSASANALVLRNPARFAKQVKDKTGLAPISESSKDAFTPEEQLLLMVSLPENLLGNSIRLLLGTGLRVQELLALTKEDITEDGSSISVKRAVKTVNGKSVIGPTKNPTSTRTIPVPNDYRPCAAYIRKNGSRPFLWKSGKTGVPYGVSSFRKAYYNALEKIPGVRKLSPHCCRHTYITQLQAKGVSMENIARLAGHSKITTTDGYLHISLETLDNAVAALNSSD